MRGPLLLLDMGNSGTKWLSLSTSSEVEVGRLAPGQSLEVLEHTFRQGTVLIASVAAPESHHEVSQMLTSRGATVWFAQPRSALDGLVNSYADPERMGVDRWLAMLAARHRVSGRLCIVDAGSALTIDLVAGDGRHEGGYIIPGGGLMERALFAATDRVRDSLAQNESIAPGRSTAEAVSHGLLLAQAGAVSLALKHSLASGDTPEVLICGGGAGPLAQVLDFKVARTPGLVMEGLLLQSQLECPTLLSPEVLGQAYQAVSISV